MDTQTATQEPAPTPPRPREAPPAPDRDAGTKPDGGAPEAARARRLPAGGFDGNFRSNKARYVLQCLLATVAVMVMLAVMSSIANPAVMAALGASAFIAFTMPETKSSQPRIMIGGYVAGIAVGSACCGLVLLLVGPAATQPTWLPVVAGGVAVGLAIFAMVVTNTEHPPAASLTLGLVLGEWATLTVVVVLVGIVVLCAIKRLLRPVLRNLL